MTPHPSRLCATPNDTTSYSLTRDRTITVTETLKRDSWWRCTGSTCDDVRWRDADQLACWLCGTGNDVQRDYQPQIGSKEAIPDTGSETGPNVAAVWTSPYRVRTYATAANTGRLQVDRTADRSASWAELSVREGLRRLTRLRRQAAWQ